MAEDEVGKVSLGLELDDSLIEKQIASSANKSGSVFARTFRATMDKAMRGFKSTVVPKVETPKVEAKIEVDVESVNQQINSLDAVLENVNAKIGVQQSKLARLKESYESTFNDDKRNKLLGQIVNVEGTLLRLTKQSDTTSAKIWKLEDSLKEAGKEAQETAEKVNDTSQALKNASKPTTKLTGDLNKATKAAVNTNKSFQVAGKSSNKMGNQFTQAFGRIAKQVLVFAVLYKAIRGSQSYMNSSMKTNREYVASLNAIKTNLATAFQPVFSAVMPAINSFMSWLAKATAYIAAFMASLFGTSYKQSFAAAKGLQQARKAMDGYGKSAKKTAMGLSALDEFNLIKTQKDDDAGGGGADPNAWNMEMPDMDIDQIQGKTDALVAGMKASFDSVWSGVKSGWAEAVKTFGPTFAEAKNKLQPELEGWKSTFSNVYSDIISLGEPLKNWWTNNVIPTWQNGILVASNVIAGLSESVRMVFDDIWNAAFPILNKFVSDGLPRISEFVMGAQDLFGNLFSIAKKIFDDIWSGAIKPAMDLVAKIIKDALDLVFGWWDEWGKKIQSGLGQAFDGIKRIWTSLWENFLKPVTDKALKVLSELWDKHLKGLVKEILNFVGKLATAALDIFNKFVVPIADWLIKTLGPAFVTIFDTVLNVIGSALGGIIDAAKGIIKALGGIVDFLAGAFTGDWKRAWEGIKTFFKGIWDSLVGIVRGVINIIIDLVNSMIKGINKFSIDIPDWVASLAGIKGGKFGFTIPEIPKLARGGIVSAPTLAMVGDNRNASIDPEVVTPLSKLQDMLSGNNVISETLLMSILEVLKEIAKKNPTITIGDTELGRVISRAVNGNVRINGGSALDV